MKKTVMSGVLAAMTASMCFTGLAHAQETAPQPPTVDKNPVVYFNPESPLPGRTVALSFTCETDDPSLTDLKEWAPVSKSSVLEDIALTRKGNIYTGTARVAADAKPGEHTVWAACTFLDNPDQVYLQEGTFTVGAEPDTSTPDTPTTPDATTKSGSTTNGTSPAVEFTPATGRPGDKVSVGFACDRDGATLTDFISATEPPLRSNRSHVLDDITLTRHGGTYTGTMQVAPNAEPGTYRHYAWCPDADGHLRIARSASFVVESPGDQPDQIAIPKTAPMLPKHTPGGTTTDTTGGTTTGDGDSNGGAGLAGLFHGAINGISHVWIVVLAFFSPNP